jgi:outer membrane protein assembly factor BamD (BamD/ComL family)
MRIGLNLVCLSVGLAGLLVCAGCQSFPGFGNGKNGLFGLKPKSKSGNQQDLSEELMDPLGARNVNRVLMDDLDPSQILTTIKTRGKTKADPKEAEQHYQKGISLYANATEEMRRDPPGTGHQKKFTDAANEFRMAAAYQPDSELEENALFYQGESYFFADRYVQSNRAFEKLIANYSGTRYLDLAEQRRLAIALYWDELSQGYWGPKFGDPKRPKTGLAGESRRVMHRIRIDDPAGQLADDATLALGKAFLRSKRYYEAADTFEDLRRNYPGSKHQFAAHMLELEARLKGYQGPSYDDEPLKKSEELLQVMARQFPKEAEENLKYLEGQHTRVQNMLVERDYSLGKYFEQRGENQSAVYVYQKLADKYDNTEFADTVRQQIAEIEKLPPTPGQPGKWLADMFPERNNDHVPLIAAGDNESFFR